MFGLIEKKKEFHARLSVLELTPRFKKLKRRASLEFYDHLDMSQIGIVCGNFEVIILHHFKVFFASLFSLGLAGRSKIAISF